MVSGSNHNSAAVLSPNFGHLAAVEPLLAHHGARAERYAFDDPSTALIRLRQFGEVLAQQAAAYTGLFAAPDEKQAELLRRLREAKVIDCEVAELFHALRMAGNSAVHQHQGTQRDALHHLRHAWRLGIWFQQAFRDPKFKGGAFVPPPDPQDAELALKTELAQLRQALAAHEAQLAELSTTAQQQALHHAELQARAKAEAEAAYADLEVALELATETEARAAKLQADFQAQLAVLQANAAAAPANTDAVLQQAQAATLQLGLDESQTRLLIDAQLVAAGWEADSVALSHSAGVRPAKGRNLAIAEWPTVQGRADYVLFVGLTPVAVVEAKRQCKNVMGAIEQAKRYSKNYLDSGAPVAMGAPWGEYLVPFLFATNGRPFLRQLKTESGIWFLDARRPTNHSRPLDGWYTPEGLRALLGQDADAALGKLQAEASDYLPLRDYQHEAIRAVEAALAQGQQNMLLAMATGTGKTRLALCLIYRLLKAGRFRRVLFLVDRNALGEQAHETFRDLRLENLQSLVDIYDVKGLGDLRPEADTRLHVATVQGIARRVLQPDDDAPPVPVDWYDCVVVDECHRGYALDLDMSDTQLIYRNEADYISKYRRVLDHFDAVRIGLTATPAPHTAEIFGEPIFTYSYRQAVLDGNLVDHEPPIQIRTQLNQEGIHWAAGDQVQVYNTATHQIDLRVTPDEIDVDVDGFNTKVVTEPFNRTVCEVLASQIDPSLPGKTMIFCATDGHADTVVFLLKEALAGLYGAIEDDTVMKITGAAHQPLAKLRQFKNERLPKIAVTVDLLTTGIDVPEIVNLVFIRRVKSRILYAQMLGRATRLCPDLYGPGVDKAYFRIYDAVGLYDAFEPFSDMKPVVAKPRLSFTQLVAELQTVPEQEYKQAVMGQLVVKLHARKRQITGEQLASFVALAGLTPPELVALLKSGDTEAASAFFATHKGVAGFLDKLQSVDGRSVLVSEHPDVLLDTQRGYGNGSKPEDYLAGFKAWLEGNQNALDALLIVTQRPRDLTRAQLRSLRVQLDQAGYTEAALRTAWAQVSNQDIAASILGFIRQQALGSPLVPYPVRVDRAVQRVLASQAWTPPQRQWLERIAKQLKADVVVDKEALDQGQFKVEGGFGRLNRVFGGQLERVLGELQEEVWRDVG